MQTEVKERLAYYECLACGWIAVGSLTDDGEYRFPEHECDMQTGELHMKVRI